MKNELKDKELKEFVSKVEKKFEHYFVAYSLRKQKDNLFVNIILDDRDVKKMGKEELYKRIGGILSNFSEKSTKKIKPKSILISDLNEDNLWNVLSESVVIFDVKIINSFINLKFPKSFLKIYKKLPRKFKLSDLEREIEKISKKKYHRNTYQNWLKSLKLAGFLNLKNKIYYKLEEPYKENLLDKLTKN